MWGNLDFLKFIKLKIGISSKISLKNVIKVIRKILKVELKEIRHIRIPQWSQIWNCKLTGQNLEKVKKLNKT